MLIILTQGPITQTSSTWYEAIKTTAATFRHTISSALESSRHIENCTSQKHRRYWAMHSLTLETACVKWHSANPTTAVEYWICCPIGAGFISPSKVLKQHVKLPSNKWVRKHLTHDNVWSAVVCSEGRYFFTACMVGQEFLQQRTESIIIFFFFWWTRVYL